MRTPQYAAQARWEESHWWHRAKTRLVSALTEALIPAGGVVVDVGCGTGALLAGLPAMYERIGLDVSDEAVSFARARFPSVSYQAVPRPREAAAVGRADLILLLDVLEHLDDDRGTLAALAAAAKPGAHFLVTVPADPSLWSPHDEALGHRRRYTFASFTSLWGGLPAREKLVSFYNARLYWPVRIAREASRRGGLSWGEAGTDVGRVPGRVGRVLEAVFAGEARRLLAALRGAAPPYGRGVSLMGVLQKQ